MPYFSSGNDKYLVIKMFAKAAVFHGSQNISFLMQRAYLMRV